MKSFFTQLFEYSRDMNQQIIDLLQANQEQAGEKSLKLMSHIINAHQIWNYRISLTGKPFGVWQEHPLDALHNLNLQNFQQTMHLIDTADFDRVLNYKTSTGLAFTNSVRDILFHTINHSTYHRGQIATDCKDHGITPLLTDYIFYKRD